MSFSFKGTTYKANKCFKITDVCYDLNPILHDIKQAEYIENWANERPTELPNDMELINAWYKCFKQLDNKEILEYFYAELTKNVLATNI
jgi:hypothetical protein